jgi:predicted nucleic acid-binding Zn ribbon protein
MWPEVRYAVSADDDSRSAPGDAARRLLARARKAAPASSSRRTRRPAPDEQPWSGPGPDGRDPASLGGALDDLVTARQWSRTLDAAGLEPRWPQIVGPELASHCRPDRLEAGVLTCIAESTAWATQIRLMQHQVLSRISTEVGPDIVSRLVVRGPSSPDWRHGPLRVKGRGPRDTYG